MSLLTQFLRNWQFLTISEENLEVEEFEEAQLGCGLELAHHGCFDLHLLKKSYNWFCLLLWQNLYF